ncbi:hypothetical protein ACH5RR_003404 [Cinchona calisaya]|uniref:Uncharacterized protein n=1 Tax=Cinchona calisaya TaxID=153742 RepID=A0ABD3AUV8_9GENT
MARFQVQRLTNELDDLLNKESIMWLPRSKMHWLKDGDRNTTYFCACAFARRNNNTIEGALGQVINGDRSEIVFSKGIAQQKKLQVLDILKIHEMAPREKYLGLLTVILVSLCLGKLIFHPWRMYLGLGTKVSLDTTLLDKFISIPEGVSFDLGIKPCLSFGLGIKPCLCRTLLGTPYLAKTNFLDGYALVPGPRLALAFPVFFPWRVIDIGLGVKVILGSIPLSIFCPRSVMGLRLALVHFL